MTDQDIIAPAFMTRYIGLVKHEPVDHALSETGKACIGLLKSIPHQQVDHSYAEGKWTVKELLQHVIDAERVFAFRALWFARKDGQPLPGFDENAWAANNPDVAAREWEDMISEFEHLRHSTALLFRSFKEDQLRACGTANDKLTSVIALGYVCAGHVAHHMRILRERYLTI